MILRLLLLGKSLLLLVTFRKNARQLKLGAFFLFISPQTDYYTNRNKNLYLQGGIHGSLVR